MNRKEKRIIVRNMKGKKGLAKKNAKGAFGRPPEYEMRARNRKEEKKEAKSLPENEKWLIDYPKTLKSVKTARNDAKNGRISPILEEK